MCLATPFAIHCLQWTAWQHKHAASGLATFYLSSKTREDNNNNCSEATKPVYSHQHTHTQLHTPANSCCCRQKRLSLLLLLLLLSSHIEHDRRTSTSFVQPSYDHSHETRTASPAQSATNCCCCRLPVGKLHACVSCAFSLRFKTRVFLKTKNS